MAIHAKVRLLGVFRGLSGKGWVPVESEEPTTVEPEEPSESPKKEVLPDYNKYVEAVAAANEHKKNIFVFFQTIDFINVNFWHWQIKH